MERLSKIPAALLALALVACGGGTSTPPASPAPPAIKTTAASTLSQTDIGSLAGAFSDNPFTGGQTAPFVAKFVTDQTFVFLQFDRAKPTDAKTLLYMGVGQKGTFCSESQPDRQAGGFPVFHQYSATSFDGGLGGKAGDQGYWLSYLALDDMTLGGRNVRVGVDYTQPGKTAPTCGSAQPATFSAAGAGPLTPDAIGKLFAIFTDQPLRGGQAPPRAFKSVNDKGLAFLQFDKNAAKDAKELRYFGLWWKSTYCKSAQPSVDFTHFHMQVAASYASGHGGPPSTPGFWGIWMGAEKFESQGREILPGVDRQFQPTPAPAC